MTIDELISRMRESLRATVVYAQPYEKDGLTVIPAAVVVGGGGGGKGASTTRDGTEKDSGEGGGFGLVARPAGAFVIKNDTVRWVPALDATRLLGTGMFVAVTVAKRLRRRRAKARLRG